jgi:hypothetical protein
MLIGVSKLTTGSEKKTEKQGMAPLPTRHLEPSQILQYLTHDLLCTTQIIKTLWLDILIKRILQGLAAKIDKKSILAFHLKKDCILWIKGIYVCIQIICVKIYMSNDYV